ncbi:MAG: hypothetical protein COU90_04565 [Candidatus Ryanbacteria bacterium CG10_big_fil_rev_8_21_14_0_10_43_42]|uniref:UDP-N-acetylmuramoyl-tripeptide--D-alanyl-D-alanine ligase n=1 Tax=Candidatus Ryanbacteria bacterium CG10_big_fil_rev_8_21_14_0_10_43_42 TaxID=1974864 RepID=A0A2M8KW05_9BACT|nr:MAG: hypothetical protein COU90_04565 [Candidatus Ryanbacteria bacterium CG10_big_fil_rev_8_21_14_0_10_43_42]
MNIAKKILQYIFRVQAKMVLKRFHPKIIAITGSVGKTSTKEAIYAVLKEKYTVRKSPKSYNSMEWGVSLTILGLVSEWNNPAGWISNIGKGIMTLMASDYPEMVIVEMGVDHPGDMDVMVSLAKPDIAVVTAIGDIPVHVEFFAGPKELALEKGRIVRAVSSDGYVILNSDDDVVHDMRAEAHGTVRTFGVGRGADVHVSGYKLTTTGKEHHVIPKGIACKADYRGTSVPIHLEGVFGKQQMYVIGAAVAVGLSLNMNMVDIARALEKNYMPSPGRLRLLPGIKESWILDDTYNASPMAMHAALDTLKDMPGVRRIAVLADMLEIGKFTIKAHESMGMLAAPIANVLITVGPRAKFIAQEARARGMKKTDVVECVSAEEAGSYLQSIMEPGDVILVKGSQSMRMEKVVEEIMAHPEDAGDLLVRQDSYWKTKT